MSMPILEYASEVVSSGAQKSMDLSDSWMEAVREECADSSSRMDAWVVMAERILASNSVGMNDLDADLWSSV